MLLSGCFSSKAPQAFYQLYCFVHITTDMEQNNKNYYNPLCYYNGVVVYLE